MNLNENTTEKQIIEHLRQIRSTLEQTDEIIFINLPLTNQYQIQTAMALVYHLQSNLNRIRYVLEEQNTAIFQKEPK